MKNITLANDTKTVVFPYDFLAKSIISIVDNSKLFKIERIVSLPCCNCEESQFINGLEVAYDFCAAIKEVESVLWIENRLFKDGYARTYILEKIKYALLNKKIIFCFQKLDAKTLHDFELFNSETEKLFYYLNVYDNGFCKDIALPQKPIVDFIIPIVSMPIYEEASLCIRKEYEKKTINFSQIFSSGIGYLCNSFAFPDFLESLQYSINEKVNMFNNYINQISYKTKSERVLVTSPVPLFPINEYDITDYGVYLNIITQLTRDGITYIVLDCDYISNEYLAYIVNYLKYRYNRRNIKFIISNLHINKIDLKELPQYIGYDVLEGYPWKIDDITKRDYSISFMKELF